MIYGSLTVNKPLLLNNWKEKNQKLIIYNKFKILIDFIIFIKNKKALNLYFL